MELRSLEIFPSLRSRLALNSRLKDSSLFLNFRRRSCDLRSKNRRTRLLLSDTCHSSTRPPPFDDDSSTSLSGLQESFNKIQDRVRIFFAVLFWMFLFFWGSAWNGNDDSRNKKGPPFKNKFK